MPQPNHYAIDDIAVQDLARFLQNIPLTNGGFAPIPSAFTPYVAQAVLNYSINLAWDAQQSRYVPIREYQTMPGGHEISYEELAPGVYKLNHRETGLYAIDTSPEAAWTELRKKVSDARRSD